jgi:hypothetical protein
LFDKYPVSRGHMLIATRRRSRCNSWKAVLP